jgi:hypothetical protein
MNEAPSLLVQITHEKKNTYGASNSTSLAAEVTVDMIMTAVCVSDLELPRMWGR